MNLKYSVLATVIALSAPMQVSAHVPKPNVYDLGNRWIITAFNDVSDVHQQWGTQSICFLPYSTMGAGIGGKWFSTTFPDWNGLWYQEGDELKMHGDYAEDKGHDHMTLVHTINLTSTGTSTIAFKDWTEWREDSSYGNTIGWAGARMSNAGDCDGWYPLPVLDKAEKAELEIRAEEFSKSLPPRLTVKGEIAVSPGQADLEKLESYLERNGLK